MKQFLAMSPDERKLVNQTGIPTDSLNNQLADWVVFARTTNPGLRIAIKGDREARGALIRDSNKIVATAVIHNPRITDKEVEGIAAMRTVSEEVLRLIGLNRAWVRSYAIIHNLARNPRTPFATAMTIMPRIQMKDLKALAENRNVSENVRRQAYRLVQTRKQ